jgi:hypothetical protein
MPTTGPRKLSIKKVAGTATVLMPIAMTATAKRTRMIEALPMPQFYPTGGPLWRRDFGRRMIDITPSVAIIDTGPQIASLQAMSALVGGRCISLAVNVLLMGCQITPRVNGVSGTKVVFGTGLVSTTSALTLTAQTTASTVMQTSSVASENCSFMPRIIADGRYVVYRGLADHSRPFAKAGANGAGTTHHALQHNCGAVMVVVAAAALLGNFDDPRHAGCQMPLDVAVEEPLAGVGGNPLQHHGAFGGDVDAVFFHRVGEV